MSIEELITTLKEQFFLSPSEKRFVKLLTESLNIPEEIIKQAIEECLRAVPPDRRRKFPIFRCFKKVLELKEMYIREKAIQEELDWKKIFSVKLKYAREYTDLKVKEPRSREEAEKILREIESTIMKKLWENLPKEKKREIVKKYERIKSEDEELFKELVKYELRRIYKLPDFSLYVK